MATSKRPTLQQAQQAYPHRFTMEHAPAWAREVRSDGTYYAPQYRSDAEWHACTTYPGEPGHLNGRRHCHSGAPSWPLGQALKAPYRLGVPSIPA